MKALLALLLGGAKFGKLLTTAGSMLVSLVAYGFVFGWPYAAGFIALLFCHEMGHFLAARQRGLAVGAPTFIPFVGAWIALKELPLDAETEAYVGMAGPLAGTLAALACYFVARHQGSQLLLAVAYSGFFLNLFNLVPVPPLDGGRMTAVISRKLWLVGIPLLVGAFVWRPSPLLLLIAVIAIPEAWRALTGEGRPDGYYEAPLGRRLEYAALYVGLVVLLAVMCHDVHDMLASARP